MMSTWVIVTLASMGFIVVMCLLGTVNTHRHKWRAVAAQPHRPPAALAMAQAPQTAVLWRCRSCPAVLAEVIAGQWTLAEVAVPPKGQVTAGLIP